MARRVVLHVGAPKTGTSYLEAILWGNRDAFEADGVWLPGRGKRAHDALMGEVRGGVWRHEAPVWTWARVAEAAARRYDTVLVTKEMLSGADAAQVAIARGPLRGEEVHVVVTARQLATALPSAWQQAVKARMRQPFGEWLEAVRRDPGHGFWRHHDPVSILSRWAPDLPASQVHVVTVPPRTAGPAELWHRFAAVLGVDPAAYTVPDRPRNESLGAVEIELLRRVNAGLGSALPMRQAYLSGVHERFTGPVLLQGTGRARFGVSGEYAAWLAERAEQSIEALRALPCTVVGDLEDLRPVTEPDLASPDEVTDAEIAELAVASLSRLLVGEAAGSSGHVAGQAQRTVSGR